jgi:molybdopterin molybdotransferase
MSVLPCSNSEATYAFSKVAMRPGKPLAAGRLGNAVFIGLPGNPQAVLAGAVAFVRPLLARMVDISVPPWLRVYAGFAMSHKAGRTEFIPVRLT